jgi:V/A-type H+-transporting ATPase subunit I
MAIAKIKKIELIGLKENEESVLVLLQRLALVQLSSDPGTEVGTAPLPGAGVNILEIEEAINFLGSFKKTSGLLAGMVKFKPQVYEQELKEVINNFDYQGFLKGLSELRNHLKNLTQHRERLLQEKHLLAPWRALKIPLDELHYTASCGVLLGVLRTNDYAGLLKNCKEEEINLFCECLDQDETNTYLVILYLKDAFERLEAVLKNHHFNFVTLSKHKGTAQERLLEINRETLVLDDQLQDAKNNIAGLAKEQFRLMSVYDYLANIKKRQAANKNLVLQQFTFSLSGWIKQKDVPRLQRSIADSSIDLAIFISEPGPQENIPVDLENSRLIEPFEFITKIYGFPKYSEIDPTPYLAPFFFLYFGFCISDVGYGFILALFSWFVLKKFKMGSQGLRFFRLFLFCGISAIIIGALTGSWFGNLLDLLAQGNKALLPLKKFKDSLVILDPMKEPTKLLGIALCFGIIQVWFGNIVAGIGNLKNRRYLDIALDQVPTLTFLFGLTGLGVIFLKLFDKTHLNLFKSASALGALALIATQGRAEKGLGSKLFYGIYNLYSALSGYLSDILSYSRLWALGLVTGVMATTINLISMQFSQIFVSVIPFINKAGVIKTILSVLILIIIFVSGHIVSFLMNLLGAFVHPVRLQFVEFFSKFFKSGGNAFRPFKVETKYIDIR